MDISERVPLHKSTGIKMRPEAPLIERRGGSASHTRRE